jgi:CDP-6-deoxy-D-xylo-4-hexulose-3-dehydrase
MEAIRKEIEAYLKQGQPEAKYWYPLSLATYGIDEIMEAVGSLITFKTTMWDKTKRFEEAFSQYLGCKECVMVNSGSTADLLLSFLLTSPAQPMLEPGDEILVPAVTWPTQIWSSMMAGLKIRVVDVNPSTLNVDVNTLASKLTPRTKAISLVHLMGNPCDMDAIMAFAKEYNLGVLEDCCEALGSEYNGKKVGTFGLGGTYSFFFSHHITTMEGGMIACPDKETASQLRILRAHGWVRNVNDSSIPDLKEYDLDPRYAFVNWGFNVRPTELQAGFGLKQLEKLPMFNSIREQYANKVFKFVDNSRFLSRPETAKKSKPSWFALPLMVKSGSPFSKNEITAFLEEKGVETRPIVAGNLAKQPTAKLFTEFNGRFSGADIIHDSGFYIGLSPMMPESHVDRLIETLNQFMNRY